MATRLLFEEGVHVLLNLTLSIGQGLSKLCLERLTNALHGNLFHVGVLEHGLHGRLEVVARRSRDSRSGWLD